MSQNAIKYLEDNKDKYSKEVLIDELRKAKYKEDDINASVKQVYSGISREEAAVVQYGGFWKRFLAFFIDAILLSIVVGFFSNFLRYSFNAFFLRAFLVPAYFIFMTNQYGATLGKMVLGLKVVSVDGGELKFVNILIRETVGKFVSGLILGIGYLMIAFSKKKQGLHDIIAKTLVVSNK